MGRLPGTPSPVGKPVHRAWADVDSAAGQYAAFVFSRRYVLYAEQAIEIDQRERLLQQPTRVQAL